MSVQALGAPARRHRSRKWWPVIGATIGALFGAGIFHFMPNVYRASTTFLIIPQRVPEDFVRSLVTTSLSERLNSISQQILSRTRLERIIQEFDLYERERQRLIMEDVIEGMRKDISISIDAPRNEGPPTSFRISYRAIDPRTAMRVTERLASLFVVENLHHRSEVADETEQFLRGAAAEAKKRLLEMDVNQRSTGRTQPRWLLAENDVLQEHYRSILRKLEDAKMAVNLERRQIGEQFRIIDGARLPERPVGPDWRPVLVWGALGGLATSFLVMVLSSMWRRRTMSEPPP